MASPKALAAIALTLIVAAPICLGYALASEDETYNEWTLDNRANLSNTILNSTTPYFGPYTSTSNNASIIVKDSQALETIRAPVYVESSSQASSLPIYTSQAVDKPNAATTVQVSFTNLNPSAIIPGTTLGTHDAYVITSTSSTSGLLTIQYIIDGVSSTVRVGTSANPPQVYRTHDFLAIRDSSSTWALYSLNTLTSIDTYHSAPDLIAQGIDSLALYTTSGAGDSIEVKMKDFVDLSSEATPYSFILDPPYGLVQAGDNYYSLVARGMTRLTVSATSDMVYVNGNAVGDVAVKALSSEDNLTLSTTTPTGEYALPAYGWSLPNIDSEHTHYWINNQINENAVFYVDLSYIPSEGTMTQSATFGGDLTVYRNTAIDNQTRIVQKIGNTWGTPHNLGEYPYVQVVVNKTGYVVSGVPGWPAMGTQPTILNQISFDSPREEFSRIQLEANSSTVHFRVDYTSAQMGTFPSTKDYTLNMNTLFPDKSYTLKFNSIGIYGDTLTVNGVPYTVTNGRILVGDTTVALKGATISSTLNNGVYDVTIGSIKVGTSTTPASITFGGEWSLTVTADFLKEETGTRATWAPGSFAFDTESFVGVIVLASAAAFIGIGIYGARSGAKVGLLLLICGGAALIALTII